MEKLFQYLEINSNIETIQILLKIKKNFNNDLNLFGCFIKDYLYIKNNHTNSQDENLYNDFVLTFETLKENTQTTHLINDLYNLSNYYLMIVFEDVNDPRSEFALATINVCDALYSYPYLIELFNNFYNQKIDSNYFYMMLELIMNIVLSDFEKQEKCELDLEIAKKDYKNIFGIRTAERYIS